MSAPIAALDVLTWSGLNGHRFNLSIKQYEFPQIVEDYDANWLVVAINAQNEQGTWRRTDPCLLTWELSWLRQWLDAIRSGVNQDDVMSFLEPELQFEFGSATPTDYEFTVVLNWNFSRTSNETPSQIRVSLTEAGIVESLKLLDAAIEGFPGRGEVAGKNARFEP